MNGIPAEELAKIEALVNGPSLERAVTASELAEWLGLTPNRVHALARDGVLPCGGGKRFPLRDAIRAYCDHARAGATGRRADTELAAEKLRLARETADKVALQNAVARSDMLDARDVANEWRRLVTDLRAGVLAIPSRVAARLALDRTATAALDAEIRGAMESIADDD